MLSDLDQRPELRGAVLRLFRQAGPGRQHAVAGDPARMGLEPEARDLDETLGVLLALAGDHVAGALACCPYSAEQLTLWGPVCRSADEEAVAGLLVRSLRGVLRTGSYESVRVQVDHRNRCLRSFFLRQGLSIWKDNVVYEACLHAGGSGGVGAPATPVDLDGPAGVQRLSFVHLEAVRDLLQGAFPESGHFDESLALREHQGYRHYGLWQDGQLVAGAALRHDPLRAWLSLIAVAPEQRGRGWAQRLMRGIMYHEWASGVRALGLEVLSDNAPAMRVYQAVGMQRLFTTTILTGPV